MIWDLSGSGLTSGILEGDRTLESEVKVKCEEEHASVIEGHLDALKVVVCLLIACLVAGFSIGISEEIRVAHSPNLGG